MSVKIAHAIGDENGKARGGKAGDQTGKEILVTNWYKRTGGWEVYLECTDKALAKIEEIQYPQSGKNHARSATSRPHIS